METKVDMEELVPMLPRTAAVDADKVPLRALCHRGCLCAAGTLALALVPALAALVCGAREVSNTADLVPRFPGGFPPTGEDLPPRSPEVLKELKSRLHRPFAGARNRTFGYAGAREGADILYNATRVAGVWERVPWKMRGVWWMKGNALPEVLGALQYGHWAEEHQALLVPRPPLMWAWWGGDRPPSRGSSVYRMGGERLAGLGALHKTLGFRFSACPSGRHCKEGAGNLSYGSLQPHPADLAQQDFVTKYVVWEMEEMADGVQPGSHYYRRCSALCRCAELGSYDMLKVVDAQGRPLEPYHSGFLAFMEGQPLLLLADER